jgi:hypothetical protein
MSLQVDAARKFLNLFWKEVRKSYLACKLQLDGEDFFSPKKRWIRAANEYRELVEPLDIANWYKAEIHKQKGKGHYLGKTLLQAHSPFLTLEGFAKVDPNHLNDFRNMGSNL